jgi:hypothetical protein
VNTPRRKTQERDPNEESRETKDVAPNVKLTNASRTLNDVRFTSFIEIVPS